MIRVTRRWRPAIHRQPRFRRSVAALLLALAVLGLGVGCYLLSERKTAAQPLAQDAVAEVGK